MKFNISYEHSGNEHSPDWLSIEIEADSKENAIIKFDKLGYAYYELIIDEINQEIRKCAINHQEIK